MSTLRRVAIILFYLLVAVVALDALIVHFTTAMPGTLAIQPSNAIQPTEFDIFLWNLWWVRHAVFDLHVNPLYTDYAIFPFTSPLAGHTLVLLWGLLSAPFQVVFGLIPTFNGIIVLAFVLAALCMYLFARRHIRHESVAVLAGLIYAFTPAMLQRASVGHLDKISIFWLPLCLLLWDKVIETRRWTWAVMTGLCLYLSWLTDFQQAMWTLLLLGPYVVYTIAHTLRARTLHARSVNLKSDTPDTGKPVSSRLPLSAAGIIRLVAIAVAAFVIPALIVPFPQLIDANRLNYPPVSLDDTAVFAFPLRNFFAPAENGDFSIGILLPILALIGIPFIGRDGQRWFWLLVALGCFVLALGPYLDLGSTRITLPYALVHRLLGNQYRTPMRFTTPGVLALTMFVALTLDDILSRRLASRITLSRFHIAIAGGLVVLFVLDYRLLQPFPITQMPDYQAYRTIAATPGDFTVLELPIGVRTGFAIVGRGEYLQYYTPTHQHPIPSGYLSRLPNEVLDFFYNDPLLGALALSHALPPQADADAQLSALIRDWKIGYVILHRDMLEQGRVKSFGDLLNRQPLLERIGEEGPLVIYKVRGW